MKKYSRLVRKANFFSDLSIGDQFYFDWSEGPHAESLMIKVSPNQCKDLDQNSPYNEYLFSVQPEQVVRKALQTTKKIKIASISDSIPEWAFNELVNMVGSWFNKGSSFDDAMLYAVTDAISHPDIEAGIGRFNLENYEEVGLSELIKQKLNITQDNPSSNTPVSDYTNPMASLNKQTKTASLTKQDFVSDWMKDVLANPYNFDINNDNMFFDALMQYDKNISTTVDWVKEVYDNCDQYMSNDQIRKLIEDWIVKKGWNVENYDY